MYNLIFSINKFNSHMYNFSISINNTLCVLTILVLTIHIYAHKYMHVNLYA